MTVVPGLLSPRVPRMGPGLVKSSRASEGLIYGRFYYGLLISHQETKVAPKTSASPTPEFRCEFAQVLSAFFRHFGVGFSQVSSPKKTPR